MKTNLISVFLLISLLASSVAVCKNTDDQEKSLQDQKAALQDKLEENIQRAKEERKKYNDLEESQKNLQEQLNFEEESYAKLNKQQLLGSYDGGQEEVVDNTTPEAVDVGELAVQKQELINNLQNQIADLVSQLDQQELVLHISEQQVEDTHQQIFDIQMQLYKLQDKSPKQVKDKKVKYPRLSGLIEKTLKRSSHLLLKKVTLKKGKKQASQQVLAGKI